MQLKTLRRELNICQEINLVLSNHEIYRYIYILRTLCPWYLWELVQCPLNLSTSFASAGSIWTLVSRFHTKASCTIQRTLGTVSWGPDSRYRSHFNLVQCSEKTLTFPYSWCIFLTPVTITQDDLNDISDRILWYDLTVYRDSWPTPGGPRIKVTSFLAASRS